MTNRDRSKPDRGPAWSHLPRLRRAHRGPHMALTVVLGLPAMAVAGLAGGVPSLAQAGALWLAFVAAQAALGLIRRPQAARSRLILSLVRLLLALLFVAAVVSILPGGRTLVSLYLPVVALAAILGPVQTVVMVLAAGAAYGAPELRNPIVADDATLRSIALAAVALILAVSIRWTRSSLDRAMRHLRRALAAGVRRERQVAGLEDVGTALASTGPTPETLDLVVGLLATRFRHRYVALYLVDGPILRLGAQRGYDSLPPIFDAGAGVIGRVFRTRQAAFVPQVGSDPDYVAGDPDVRSEIAVPLLNQGELLGVLNVESTAAVLLDTDDRRAIQVVGDRLAVSIALGRDRQRLGERERLSRHLAEFSAAVSATLDPDRLYDAIVRSVSQVVPVEVAGVTVLEPATGRYVLRAVAGMDGHVVGREVRPGEGMAGRAIRDRAIVVSDAFEHDDLADAVRDAVEGGFAAAAGVPAIREGVVVAVISLARRIGPFSDAEHDAMLLMASQAALAISNVLLHAEVNEMAIRDPLTGLYNRRYFDAVFEQLLASHGRDPAGRPPLAAVMFDLDDFGRINKQHGHQLGDTVLQAFGQLLAGRFRESDLVARYGGEEFVVILDRTPVEDATRLAEAVRAAMAARRFPGADGQPFQVTVSAGCAELEPDQPSREALLRAADVALFLAKRAGRDQVVAQPAPVRRPRRDAGHLDTAALSPGPSLDALAPHAPTGGWNR